MAQLGGPIGLWPTQNIFVFVGSYRHRVPRVKGLRKVAPNKGLVQIRGPLQKGVLQIRGPCK